MEFKMGKVVLVILGVFLFKVIVADSYMDKNRRPSSIKVRSVSVPPSK
jgi:uncharacterized membrane protein YqhA